MPDLTRLSAAEVARGVAAGRLTASEVLAASLDRIARVDPVVRAYVAVLEPAARAQAAALDRAAREGAAPGPLQGVPTAVKDLMPVAGATMTAGSAFLRRPADRDAPAVARLRAAGAVIVGLTTLHEFALGVTGVNPHAPTARNPWRLDRVAGGSSSGSAAAVAARLAAVALGTDTGGSIRIPAAFCGIVGLKPTFGRVTRRDVLPLAASFDTVGPMTRTVEDAALCLEVLAGPDPDDPAANERPAGGYLDALRHAPAGVVGRLAGEFFEADLDPGVARALDDASRALEQAGLPVRSVALPSAEAAHEAQLVVLRSEAAAFHRQTFPGREAEYGPDVRTVLAQGAAERPEAVEAARGVLRRLAAEVEAAWADVAFLLAPACPTGAPTIADADPAGPHWPQVRRQVARFTRIFNATGLPTVALPAGFAADGLPAAVQLAAPPFEEARLLAAAAGLERALGFALPDLPRGVD